MDWLGTRRTFLGWTNWIFAAGGLAGQAPPLAAAVTTHNEGEDYYEKLGVAKIINAAGTYTVLTASTMPPPTATCPPLCRSRPATMRKSVVLPQPRGPRRATISPGSTRRLTPSTATVWPKRWVMPSRARATPRVVTGSFDLFVRRLGRARQRRRGRMIIAPRF